MRVKKYCLDDQQKQKIIQLLEPRGGIKNNSLKAELISHRMNTILDDLEHRMNTDAWLELDSRGRVTIRKQKEIEEKEEKEADRIARNFNTLSQELGKLAKTLRKIDPVVLSHLDDNFSLFHFEALQARSPDKTTRRAVLPLNELISRTYEWASRAKVKVKEEGRSYFDRFFHEIEEFWFYNVSDKEILPNTNFRKLIVILRNSDGADDDDIVKKQLKRWTAKRRGGDKSKP